MIAAVIGAILLAGAGIDLALMLALGRTIADDAPDVPREEDPARYRRHLIFNAAAGAAGLALLAIGLS